MPSGWQKAAWLGMAIAAQISARSDCCKKHPVPSGRNRSAVAGVKQIASIKRRRHPTDQTRIGVLSRSLRSTHPVRQIGHGSILQ
jgi:hypothetical protein